MEICTVQTCVILLWDRGTPALHTSHQAHRHTSLDPPATLGRGRGTTTTTRSNILQGCGPKVRFTCTRLSYAKAKARRAAGRATSGSSRGAVNARPTYIDRFLDHPFPSGPRQYQCRRTRKPHIPRRGDLHRRVLTTPTSRPQGSPTCSCVFMPYGMRRLVHSHITHTLISSRT